MLKRVLKMTASEKIKREKYKCHYGLYIPSLSPES